MSEVERRPRVDSLDLVALAGLVFLFIGIWWVYRPAALIVLGAGLVAYAFLSARPSANSKGETS